MIKEFIESLKLKDLVFFVLIIVLFFMYFKKNKKEGFTYTSPTDAIQKGTFKADVEEALGENIQAIKNLGTLAGQFITSDNLLDLSNVDFKVKSLDVVKNLTVGGNFNIAELLGLPLIGSQCIKEDGTMDYYGNACGTNLVQSLPTNNRGVTEAYTKNLKPHGSSCATSSAGSKCQNIYQIVSSA